MNYKEREKYEGCQMQAWPNMINCAYNSENRTFPKPFMTYEGICTRSLHTLFITQIARILIKCIFYQQK